MPSMTWAILLLGTAGLTTALAGSGQDPCEAGAECPSDFEGLLQRNLQVLPLKPPTPAPAPTPPNYFRQLLHNTGDLQYTAKIKLGGEALEAVMDTGSYELLAFGVFCRTCGTAAKYDYQASPTYEPGLLSTVFAFGSGSCRCLDGTDRLQIGNFTVEKQPFWEVMSASMPVLRTATFNAILGLGPPGEPQAMAMMMAEEHPQERSIAMIIWNKRDSVLENLNVRYFSACLGWESGSPGHLVWDDVPPEAQPVEFAEIKVIDEIKWAVSLTSPRFEVAATKDSSAKSIRLGCEYGCKAVVDTGTSLIAVPTDTFNHALQALNKIDRDCSNLHEMPDLTFNLGNATYSLPPHSYIGVIEGYVASDVEDMMSPKPVREVIACQLLLMNSGSLGGEDLWVLGMPFFRYYYTTFDLGAHPYYWQGRRIWTAPAGENCVPSGPANHTDRLDKARQKGAWHINGTMIRPPHRMRTPRPAGSADKSALPGSALGAEDWQQWPRMINTTERARPPSSSEAAALIASRKGDATRAVEGP